MSISDEQWVAAARARAAAGEWERPADVMFAELKRQSMAQAAPEPLAANCPYCEAHPPLLRMQRYELQSVDPLLFCGSCYGFWATGDALARGVADPRYDHPALEARPAPRRCRACFGHLKPDHTCAKCGQPVPPLDCPQCRAPMERFEKEGALLDQCRPCHGLWFDTGEIAQVYRLAPVQGLAASTVDEHACDDEPPGWAIALNMATRFVFPFLPL